MHNEPWKSGLLYRIDSYVGMLQLLMRQSKKLVHFDTKPSWNNALKSSLCSLKAAISKKHTLRNTALILFSQIDTDKKHFSGLYHQRNISVFKDSFIFRLINMWQNQYIMALLAQQEEMTDFRNELELKLIREILQTDPWVILSRYLKLGRTSIFLMVLYTICSNL